MFSGKIALPVCLWITLACGCSNAPTGTPVNAAVSSASTPGISIAAATTILKIEQPSGASSPAATPATPVTPALLEFGSEQQVGVDGFQELPPRIRAAVGEECKYIGKPIPLLTLHSQLWVAAPTDTDCMGSGGGYMRLILDGEGKEPTVVLGTSAVVGIELDPATTHHDLPDVFVEDASNCCGSGNTGYRYDGKEYKEATGRLEANLASRILDEVKDPAIPGVDTRGGCSLKEGSFWSDSDNPGLKIVVSMCNDADQTRVWLIRRSGADKQASVEILAREDLSEDNVIVTWENEAKTTDVIFPGAKPASVTWHFDKDKFNRIPPSTPPASSTTSAPGSPAEAAGSK